MPSGHSKQTPGTWEHEQAQHRIVARIVGLEYGSRPVSPDDMLAWLCRDKVVSVRTETWGAPGHASMSFLTMKRGGSRAEFHAPTLHAALEQAVIAVGRAG